MKFINDVITDEDRKNFDFSVFKQAPLFARPVRPSSWTVDREAGVFLIWLGRDRPDNDEESYKKGVEYFSLWWNGFNTECKLWRTEHAPNSITWHQDWIGVPEEHMSQKPKVCEVLKQALQTYQYFSFFNPFIKTPMPPFEEIKFDF